jgi:hypothetical protein
MADEWKPISDAELDDWYRVHNERDADGQTAGIGIQARDRTIRRLIDELRITRQELDSARQVVREDMTEIRRLRDGRGA